MLAVRPVDFRKGLDGVALFVREQRAGSENANVVLNIPARRHEPAPPPAIVVPASLALATPMMAVRARYARLRPFCPVANHGEGNAATHDGDHRLRCM